MKKEFKNEEKSSSMTDEKQLDEVKNKGGKRSRTNNRKRKNGKKNSKSGSDYRKASRDNDASWYANNPQILKAAASISYYTPLGATPSLESMVEDDGSTQAQISITTHANEIPGVMALDYIHGPAGDNAFPVEAVDVAANNIYSFIRHANSGGKNYDAPDVMMYLLAMDEAYQLFALGQRVYGLMRLYSQTNRYLPQVLVEAAGFNFESLQGNMANFNSALNVFAAQLSAFCVPADLPYFRRHFWLASTVFMDEDVIKPQLYLHRPVLYRIYDDYSSDQGGQLTAFTHKYAVKHGYNASVVEHNLQTEGSMGYTVDEYLDVLNSCITFLNGSSDVGLISGDIKKAYGDSNLFMLSPIPTDYTIIPEKNEEALSQISNYYSVLGFGGLLHDTDKMSRFNITQVVGTETTPPQIVYNPEMRIFQMKVAELPKILNMHKSDVTPEDTIVASRWLNTVEAFGVESGNPVYRFSSVGSEFGCGINIFTFTKSTGAISADSVKSLTFDTHMLSNPFYNAYVAKLMEAFDWHPLLAIWLVDEDTTPDTIIVDDVLLDFANYTIVQKKAISNMNQTAILSMFNVPQLGSF